jgi:hypothetical protein
LIAYCPITLPFHEVGQRRVLSEEIARPYPPLHATVAGADSCVSTPEAWLTEYIVMTLPPYDETYAHLLSGVIASWMGSLPVATVAGANGVSAPVVASTENCETVAGVRLTT